MKYTIKIYYENGCHSEHHFLTENYVNKLIKSFEKRDVFTIPGNPRVSVINFEKVLHMTYELCNEDL